MEIQKYIEKSLAIIPARGGSKRLPLKNIKELGGKPLIQYSIEYARRQGVGRIVVSTDDSQIANIAKGLGVEVAIRPAELATDTTPTVDVLRHHAEQLDGLEDSTLVILLQPTNPLRPESLLSEAVASFYQTGGETLFTVTRDPHKLGKIVDGKFVPFNYYFGQRSQDMEPLYYENGLLYLATVAALKKGVLMDDSSIPFIVESDLADIDIDTADDFAKAERKLRTL